MNRQLAACWHTWAQSANEQAAALNAMRRGAAFIANRDVASAWHAWATNALDQAATLRQLRSGVGRLLNGQLARGLASWQEWSCEKAVAARVCSRLLHRSIARALSTWADKASERYRACDAVRVQSLIAACSSATAHGRKLRPLRRQHSRLFGVAWALLSTASSSSAGSRGPLMRPSTRPH